jgi:hypothetical protein
MLRRLTLAVALLVLVALLVARFSSGPTVLPSRSVVGTDAVVEMTPTLTPVATPTPSPAALPGGAFATFDPLALAWALPGGSKCQTLAPINSNSVYGTDRHSSWAIGCRHASGDRTVYLLLADAIKADLERRGVAELSSHGTTNDAPGPLENDWLLAGNGAVVFARIIAFDDGSMLSMAVTLDSGTQ